MSNNSFAGINFEDPNSKDIFEVMSETMCSEYKTKNESMFLDNLNVKKMDDNSLVVSGNVDSNYQSEKLYIKYSACNPPTYNSSFSGSGLPFPNEDVAYQNTPNRGVVEVMNGKFEFSLRYPNSYYINMGTIYIPPHVKLIIVNSSNKQLGDVQDIVLGTGIPFRTLTWPEQRKWSEGPLFYKNNNLSVRTQYQILLDSSYPSINRVPDNFWGLKPPN